MVDVSIIMINYKTSDLVLKAIESVRANTFGIAYEIIVIDNSEDDKEYKKLSQLNDIILLVTESNLGFGKANNLGVENSQGEYCLFLNSDTLLINNAICELYAFIKVMPDVGAVGPNLFTIDLQPNHSFQQNKKTVINDSLRQICPTYRKNNKGFNTYEDPIEVFGFICGAALMVKKDNFEKLGGFDKDIFMYAEDVLLCSRIKSELKMKLYNVPAAKIIHFEGASIGHFSEHKLKTMLEGTYIYYLKQYGENTARNYVKMMLFVSRLKYLLSKTLKQTDKCYYYSKCCKVYADKLEAIA